MSTAASYLDRLLEPFADCLTPDVAAKIADMRADDEVQARMEYLADRANDGSLTPDEEEEYAACLHAIDVIAVLQAKARSHLRRAS
jgi:hypothetical protein